MGIDTYKIVFVPYHKLNRNCAFKNKPLVATKQIYLIANYLRNMFGT